MSEVEKTSYCMPECTTLIQLARDFIGIKNRPDFTEDKNKKLCEKFAVSHACEIGQNVCYENKRCE